MRISDLDKLNLFIPKIIDSNEGFSFKDFNQMNSIFISDTIPLTSLMSDYIGKFKFSKKFNRKIYLNKYIKTPKLVYTRDLIKTRSSMLKSQAILETDIRSADCYDLTLENIAFRKNFGYIQSINKLNSLLEKDIFINEKSYLNIFWIMSNNKTNIETNEDDSTINNSSLHLMRTHKSMFLDPNNNKKIRNIYLLFPLDEEEDKESVNLKFYIVKIYEEGSDFNYTKLNYIIEKSYTNVERIQKKPLFTLNIKKSNADESTILDNTFNITNTDSILQNEKEDQDTNIDDKTPDRSIKEKNIYTNDKNQLNKTRYDQLKKTYTDDVYHNEMKSMFESSIKNFIPTISLIEHKVENADDGITDQDKHTFKLKDLENNKEKEISLLIPRIVDEKFFRIYDKKYILSNQVYSNLVNKIKEDTVAFTSSHTKTIIYTQGKSDERIGKYFAKNPLNIQTVNQYSVSDNKDIPNSLHVIFKYVPIFQYKNYYISYDIYSAKYIFKNENDQEHPKRSIIGIRKDLYPNKSILSNKDLLHNYIKEVYTKYGSDAVIIYNSSIDSINNKPFLLEMKHELENTDASIKKMPIPGSSQFARMNIAGKKVPVFISMLIAFKNDNPSGKLHDFFEKYFLDNVHIEISDNNLNIDNIISIKLKDCYINIFIYESLVASELLFSQLRKIDMSKYSNSDLKENNDIDLLLISFFESQKLQADAVINSLSIGLKSILDPITKEMIKKTNYEYPMGNKSIKPRDLVEILYYCVYLLNDRTYKSGNDFSGYRIRNMETIPAMVFKLMSDKASKAKKESESKIKNRRKAIDALSIHQNELMEEFRNLTTFESFSDLNIANELGLTSKATYKGFAGMNNNRSIAYNLRATDPSSIGFIDMGNNVDNLNVGSNRMMPLNPNIDDVRGSSSKNKKLRDKVMSDTILTDDETSSLLSFDIYNEPYIASSADAPRISMSSIQARHGIPLSSYDDLPIKTGVEDTVKNIVSSSYVIKSPSHSEIFKVKSIDTDKKIISLIDKSNKLTDISYADKVVNNSGGGFHILKEFEPCVKVGENVRKEQPIALDKGSFKNGNYTNAKLLRTTLLNFAETLEDGAIISESAAKELEFNYVTEKSILIRNDQTIIKMINKIGENVSVGSPLLVFSKDDEDDINSIFGNLNKDLENEDGVGLNTYIKSKYPGKIVDIKIQYNGELRNIKALKEALRHIPKENVQQIKTDRIAGEIAPNGILITYYILTKIPAMTGSKTTAQSTKSVFVVWPDDKMPRTLKGERIDYIFSTFSIITRIIFVLVR